MKPGFDRVKRYGLALPAAGGGLPVADVAGGDRTIEAERASGHEQGAQRVGLAKWRPALRTLNRRGWPWRVARLHDGRVEGEGDLAQAASRR